MSALQLNSARQSDFESSPRHEEVSVKFNSGGRLAEDDSRDLSLGIHDRRVGECVYSFSSADRYTKYMHPSLRSNAATLLSPANPTLARSCYCGEPRD